MRIDVYALPALIPNDNIGDATAVVIDTLRATSALVYATAAGVRNIIPLLDIEEAKQLKRNGLNGKVLPKDILLGGERNGVKIDGFDLANSPQSYTPETVDGKTLIFTTTNGTVAMNAVRSAKNVLLAALVNSAAVVRKVENEEKVVIVCAGTCGEETEEDLLTAGSVVYRLCMSKTVEVQLNETAERVKRLWENTVLNQDGTVSKTLLLECIRQSIGGQNCLRLGLEADIEAATQLDLFDVVPVVFPNSDVKPPKKTKWYWNVIGAVFALWCLGGINVLLLQDLPLLLFLLVLGFVFFYPMTKIVPQGQPRIRQRFIAVLYGTLWTCFVLATAWVLFAFVIPPFFISPQTTYLTEPRSKEFYGIDYAAVFEKQLESNAAGVPSKENGFHLLTETFGRQFFGTITDEHWHRLCQYLELPSEIEPKHTFVHWTKYVNALPPEEKEIVEKPAGRIMLPFFEEAVPIVQRWLDDNNAAIDMFAVAAQKQVMYAPLVFDGILINTLLPYNAAFRDMVRAVHVRIRYRLATGEIDKAWDDVLTIYRLGELHRPTAWNLVTTLLDNAIIGMANWSAESVMLHSDWSADEILQKIKEIEPFLQPFSEDEIIGNLRSERFVALDAVTQLANGTYNIGDLGDDNAVPNRDLWERLKAKTFIRFSRMGIVMVELNRKFDKMEQQYFKDEPISDDDMKTFDMYVLLKMYAWYGRYGTIPLLIGWLMGDLLCPLSKRGGIVSNAATLVLHCFVFSSLWSHTVGIIAGIIPTSWMFCWDVISTRFRLTRFPKTLTAKRFGIS